jgi:hypothetical protein
MSLIIDNEVELNILMSRTGVSTNLLQQNTTTTMTTLIIQPHTLSIDTTIPKIPCVDGKDYSIFTF